MGSLMVNLGRVLIGLGLGTIGSWFGGGTTVVDENGSSQKGTFLIIGVTTVVVSVVAYFVCKMKK